MPGASLFTLLDDISSVLDDVATLTKVAAGKTAGVLGDDLALNAEQVSGVRADRELPVVWAVARGSLVNKAILIPAALALSIFLPRWVTPLLMVGGAYLCFEGFEKVVHSLFHKQNSHAPLAQVPQNPKEDGSAERALSESAKVRGAIRTDFVLSAEIVTIALASVNSAPLMTRTLALLAIGLTMTVGVYGVVALIVKMDDVGGFLYRRGRSRGLRILGKAIVMAAPWLMKGLALAGTVAMFLVGGGIVAHGLPWIHALQPAEHGGAALVNNAMVLLANGLTGVATGLLIWGLNLLRQRVAATRG